MLEYSADLNRCGILDQEGKTAVHRRQHFPYSSKHFHHFLIGVAVSLSAKRTFRRPLISGVLCQVMHFGFVVRGHAIAVFSAALYHSL